MVETAAIEEEYCTRTKTGSEQALGDRLSQAS